MTAYRAVHEVRIFGRNARDAEELDKALMVFVRNTSPAHRTQASQIQVKYNRPENTFGTFYYLGLYQDGEVVGFSMFAYYPGSRVVVIDHLTIEASYRQHRAFYIFAALIQECIEEHCPEYDYVVCEIAVDPQYSDDDVSGTSLIWLLRQIGFGRVNVKYALPSMEAKSYRKPLQGALMLRGAQKTRQIRSEDLIDIHYVILFEHYLPWFKDFFGETLSKYKSHLEETHKFFQKQLTSKSTVPVNGNRHDELSGRPKRKRHTFIGLPIRAIGHFTLFIGLLSTIVAATWFLSLSEQVALIFGIFIVVAYAALTALSDPKALHVLQGIRSVITKLISRK